MTPKIALGISLVALLSAWSGSAHAVDEAHKETIRSLSTEAASDYQRAHYSAAKAKFGSAYEMAKVPKLAVWLARSNEKLGQLVAAYELYTEALSLQPNELWKGTAQQDAQKDARIEMEALLPRIPKLTISVEGATPEEVSVTLDGILVPSATLSAERLLDPGTCQIVAKRGSDTVNETLTFVERDKKQSVLRFKQAASPAASAATPLANAPRAPVEPGHATSRSNAGDSTTNRQRTLGWIGIGVGAAGLAFGATTGILVAAKYGDLKSKCADRQCGPDQASEVDSYDSLRTLSTVGFIAGGVVGAAGVALLLTSPKQALAATAALWVSPGMAGIEGKF